MISMKIDAGQHKISSSILKKLGDKSDKVLADATNRALVGMRTDATKLIVAESGIARKKIFSAFTVIKISRSGDFNNGRVEITGRPTGLSKFKHKFKKTKKTTRGFSPGSLSVNIGKKSIVFRHAFVATMKSGHIGIFERQRGVKTSSGREKLNELFGPSIPQFAGRKHISDTVQKMAQKRFETRFNQQTERWLKKTGAK